MTLEEAVIEAIAAGAEIENPESHPMRLKLAGGWQQKVARDVVVEIMAADPARVDHALSRWQGMREYVGRYMEALEAGDEKRKAWWRTRLREDYNYDGRLPGDPR